MSQFGINIFMRPVSGSVLNHFQWYQAWRNTRIRAFEVFPRFKSTTFTKPKGNTHVPLRRLVVGFLSLVPWFDPKSGHTRFVVEKVALGQVFSENIGFLHQFSFHQMFRTHLSTGTSIIGQLVVTFRSTTQHESEIYSVIIIMIYLRTQVIFGIYDEKYETRRWTVNGGKEIVACKSKWIFIKKSENRQE
jgi:hypothetical protein